MAITKFQHKIGVIADDLVPRTEPKWIEASPPYSVDEANCQVSSMPRTKPASVIHIYIYPIHIYPIHISRETRLKGKSLPNGVSLSLERKPRRKNVAKK